MTTRYLAVSLTVLLASAAMPAEAQLVNQDRLRINGYTNFMYEYSPSDVGRGDRNGSFDADQFDLVVNVLPTDRLRLSTDLRWEHGVTSEDGRGNVEVSHALAEYTLFDALRLRAGKMLTPFGIYNEIHTATPAIFLYKEPYAIAKPDKMGFPTRFFTRAGTGIGATGVGHFGGAQADYSVMVTNGETSGDVNAFEEDDNTHKSVSGRVRLRPVESLTLGASYWNDQRTELDDAGDDTGLRTRQNAVGTMLQWSPRNLLVEGEWVRGTYDEALSAAQVGNGYYGSASYLVKDRVRPYFFYQLLDPDADQRNDRATMWGPGVTTRVDGALFVKLEVLRVSSELNNSRHRGNDYVELNAAVAVAF